MHCVEGNNDTKKELPYLPDEIVTMIYDYIRPKKGFQFESGQTFKCNGFNVKITKVQKRIFYNEIMIQGKRIFKEEEYFFQTRIKLDEFIHNPYKDMYWGEDNFMGFALNKSMYV